MSRRRKRAAILSEKRWTWRDVFGMTEVPEADDDAIVGEASQGGLAPLVNAPLRTRPAYRSRPWSAAELVVVPRRRRLGQRWRARRRERVWDVASGRNIKWKTASPGIANRGVGGSSNGSNVGPGSLPAGERQRGAQLGIDVGQLRSRKHADPPDDRRRQACVRCHHIYVNVAPCYLRVWRIRTMSRRCSAVTSGNARSSPSSASSTMALTIARVHHLRSAGTTNQGASAEVVSRIIWS